MRRGRDEGGRNGVLKVSGEMPPFGLISGSAPPCQVSRCQDSAWERLKPCWEIAAAPQIVSRSKGADQECHLPMCELIALS